MCYIVQEQTGFVNHYTLVEHSSSTLVYRVVHSSIL